jgi:hypothetical protein
MFLIYFLIAYIIVVCSVLCVALFGRTPLCKGTFLEKAADYIFGGWIFALVCVPLPARTCLAAELWLRLPLY